MAELESIARPYAKAAFEYAQANDALPNWQHMLAAMAAVGEDADIQALLHNPKVSSAQLATLTTDVLDTQLDDAGRNFVRLLGVRGRIGAMSAISRLFQHLYAEKQQKVTAKVFVAQPLTTEQQLKLQQALQKRLDKEVELDIIIDPSVYGGVRVQANDIVIDGTIRGRLQRLFENLNA